MSHDVKRSDRFSRFAAVILVSGAMVAMAGCQKHENGDHDHDDHDHAGSGNASDSPGGAHDHGSHDHGDGHAHDHHAMDVPAAYAGRTNPFAGDAGAALEGSEIYAARCANCHGDRGAGDGRAAPKLDPKPTDFTERDHMAAMKDDYLFWRMAEGGEMTPFHSKMPAWKEKLSEEERWKVLSFVRTLAR